MKLAEALNGRKNLETRISQIRKLMVNTVKVQEGDSPIEDPEVLMSELSCCLEKLERYIYDINVTNMQIVDEDGKTMTKLLAERDVLKKHIDVLRQTFDQATEVPGRYNRNEIKYVITIDGKSLRQQLEQLSQQYRQLDMKIQALNFSCDLIEQ